MGVIKDDMEEEGAGAGCGAAAVVLPFPSNAALVPLAVPAVLLSGGEDKDADSHGDGHDGAEQSEEEEEEEVEEEEEEEEGWCEIRRERGHQHTRTPVTYLERRATVS